MPFLDTYSKVMKAFVHTKPCNTNVIKALFLITKNWTQPNCLIGEWINNL